MTATSTPRSRPSAPDPLRWRLASLLRQLEQPLLGLGAIVAILLGFFGYRSYFTGTGKPIGLVDTLYADLELFKLTSRVEGGRVPLALDAARLLAPAVSGYAAFRGVVALYRDGFDRVRARMARRHVVVIGAGEAALVVARTLARSNRKVVLVDDTPRAERSSVLRTQGVVTIAATGALTETLRAAGAARAREVLALTADDARNVDLTLRARDLAPHRATPRALGAVSDPALCALLRIEAIEGQQEPRMDFLNGVELTARAVEQLLRSHGLHGDLLVLAPRAEGLQLCVRLARTAFAGTVHLGGPAAEEIARALADRLGSDSASLRWRTTTDTTPDAAVRNAVIVGTDSTSIASATQIAHALPRDSLVVAVLPDCAHLCSLVDSANGSGGAAIQLVDSLACWLDADLVLGGSVEVIARATHESYRRALASTAKLTDPSRAAWDQLGEHLKRSNRDQARHLWTKLDAAGCALGLDDGDRTQFRFEPAEVEVLSRMEHERWVAERLVDGWRAALATRTAKRSPYLVAWEDLTEEIRDLDRAAVIGIPEFVADLGYRVVRTSAVGTRAAETSAVGTSAVTAERPDTIAAPIP